MKIRFYNARIMTMADGCDVKEGEIWIEGKHISYVGEAREDAAELAWDRQINAVGNLIMPGFKDAHTHSGMTFLRSKADDLPLEEWLNKQVFPLEAKLSGEDVYHLSKLAILEYLTSGITSNYDMYFFPDQISRASIEMGFRTVLCCPITSFSGDTAKGVEDNYLKYNSYHELISYTLGFHAEYTAETSLLKEIAELSQKYHAPVFNHNSETRISVEQCIERSGMTPTVFLDSLGMFEYGGGGYHCVHMTEEDLSIFAQKGLTAVTNSGSNMKLASGIAPIKRMMEAGIPVAIGTDGPASNNCLDMFREMFLVTGLAKIRENDASVVDAGSVLKMSTVNGAKAMGLGDCDVLAKGKLADLVMIDLHQPNMQPLNNIAKNIVYSGSKSNVKLTMINGKILYEDGRFYVGENPEDIYAEANKIVAKLVK